MYSWLVALGVPVLFLCELSLAYALVPLACERGTPFILHALTGSSLVACAVAALFAWRAFAASGHDVENRAQRGFAGSLSVASSAIVALALIGQWIALFVIPPCAG